MSILKRILIRLTKTGTLKFKATSSIVALVVAGVIITLIPHANLLAIMDALDLLLGNQLQP